MVVQFSTTTFTLRLNLFRDAPIVCHAFGDFVEFMVFSFTAAFSIGGGTPQPEADDTADEVQNEADAAHA